MRRALAAAALAAMLVIGLATGAWASASNVFTNPNGSYLSPATAGIFGQAICTSPTGTATIVFSAPAGLGYTFAGTTEVACTGTQQPWSAVLTGGPFQLGHLYIVHATMTDATGTINRQGKVTLL